MTLSASNTSTVPPGLTCPHCGSGSFTTTTEAQTHIAGNGEIVCTLFMSRVACASCGRMITGPGVRPVT